MTGTDKSCVYSCVYVYLKTKMETQFQALLNMNKIVESFSFLMFRSFTLRRLHTRLLLGYSAWNPNLKMSFTLPVLGTYLLRHATNFAPEGTTLPSEAKCHYMLLQNSASSIYFALTKYNCFKRK